MCSGCGMIIPDTGSWFLSIPDPTTATKRRGKRICCSTFIVASNFTKLKIILFLAGLWDIPFQIVTVAAAPTYLFKRNIIIITIAHVTYPCLSSSRRWDCPCFPPVARSPCSGSWTGTRAAPPRAPSLQQRRYLSHSLRGKGAQCFYTDLHVCEVHRYSELSPRPSCAHITTKMQILTGW